MILAVDTWPFIMFISNGQGRITPKFKSKCSPFFYPTNMHLGHETLVLEQSSKESEPKRVIYSFKAITIIQVCKQHSQSNKMKTTHFKWLNFKNLQLRTQVLNNCKQILKKRFSHFEWDKTRTSTLLEFWNKFDVLEKKNSELECE